MATAEKKVQEYKSLVLLALVVGAGALGAGLAVRRDGGADVPPADALWELGDGTKVVRASGVEVRIRSFSSGLVLVSRWLSPEEEKVVANVRRALRDDADGAKFGLTELQKKQVRGLGIYSPGAPSTNQREAVAETWQNYEAAERADAAATRAATKSATSGATSSAGPVADTGVRKATMRGLLFAAVAALDEDERSLPAKVAHLRRVVTAEQFDMLAGKEAAATLPGKVETKPAGKSVTASATKPGTKPTTSVETQAVTRPATRASTETETRPATTGKGIFDFQ